MKFHIGMMIFAWGAITVLYSEFSSVFFPSWTLLICSSRSRYRLKFLSHNLQILFVVFEVDVVTISDFVSSSLFSDLFLWTYLMNLLILRQYENMQFKKLVEFFSNSDISNLYHFVEHVFQKIWEEYKFLFQKFFEIFPIYWH